MRRFACIVVVILFVLSVSSAGAPAQTALPDMDVILIAEVQDATAWAALHQEVIGTVGDVKPLRATLPAGTGGNRSVIVYQPKFSASVITADARRVVKVGVTGKIRGSDALASVTAFEMAAIDVQAGALTNELVLLYGLSGVTAQLVELHLMRP